MPLLAVIACYSVTIMNAFALNTGTFLPEGPAALAMIEDALDHLVDGPRTSPAIVRRLLVRACEGVPEPVTREAIERFEDAYERAYALLPDPGLAPAAMDGGTRGRLLLREATLRTELASLREGIATEGAKSADGGTMDREGGASRFAIPLGADFNDGDVEPDASFLMLEQPELIERRARRRARLRTIGGHVAHAALRAIALGSALAIVLAFVRLV